MKRLFSLLVLTLLVLISVKVHAATEIKLAILAPEGSTWHKVMSEWDKELTSATGGRVKLKIYAGGVLGDEKDVIRKMRIGQVHAAGLTGLGLGMVNPAVRVLELPMLVSNYKEADAVAKKVWPKLQSGFANKGFEILGVAETGFVNIFSNKPIASRDDMKGMKMWAWEGDPLVEELYKVFKIVPIPLPITDVMTSLQTNLIDAVYAPPLGAIALQWFTHTKYLTDLKLADSTGGIIITKKALALLSPADQNILKTTAKKYAKMLVDRTRADNEKSYKTLFEAGLKQVKVADEEVERIRNTSKEVWNKLVGKLYTKALLDEAIAAVEAERFRD
ncbi:MAG: TRAP transporter substrate-binding protein DctP [Pseudomonadota bacterium]